MKVVKVHCGVELHPRGRGRSAVAIGDYRIWERREGGLLPDILFLKHACSILRQSCNPVGGFSRMEQVRPTENWLGSSMNHIQGWMAVWECCRYALEKGCLLTAGEGEGRKNEAKSFLLYSSTALGRLQHGTGNCHELSDLGSGMQTNPSWGCGTLHRGKTILLRDSHTVTIKQEGSVHWGCENQGCEFVPAVGGRSTICALQLNSCFSKSSHKYNIRREIRLNTEGQGMPRTMSDLGNFLGQVSNAPQTPRDVPATLSGAWTQLTCQRGTRHSQPYYNIILYHLK